jgi:DNA-binding Xre family transcriptional regulator
MGHSATDQVAGNLRAELARRKISGRGLARGLGWTTSTTARLLSGEQRLTVDELAAVAAFLEVSPGSLLEATAEQSA